MGWVEDYLNLLDRQIVAIDRIVTADLSDADLEGMAGRISRERMAYLSQYAAQETDARIEHARALDSLRTTRQRLREQATRAAARKQNAAIEAATAALHSRRGRP